ncbi:MAG: type II secretion system protein [Phycisphaerales bacterium]|jgi:prepilin-type N-terminal cleavage/methylation domain-containing protein|nr:type II secretion system protein [Phycisphaerales bacterium]
MLELSRTNRKAFTLIEMIVVIIILGVMAAMVVPRMSGNRDREFNLITDQVADVVLMFAHRISTSNQPSGLRYLPETRQLELLSKVEEDGERFWRIDPLSSPIKFPDWITQDSVSIYTDGEFSDTTQWPLTTTPGEMRPHIEVVIEWEERSAIISLAPHAIGPNIWLDGQGSDPIMPIDLDAEGRGRDEW